MPTLAELLNGTGDIEFSLEIDYRNVATDTEGTIYLSYLGRIPDTGPADTPANTSFPMLILDPGTLTYRLSEDLLFSGAAQVELGEVRLDNRPAAENAAGPFDHWHEWTFSGREVRCKGGAPDAHYSTFETVWTGKMLWEPVISPSEVRIGMQSPMELLNVPLRVNRYVGIPTGLKYLTTDGSASAPHLAAYDLLSYTLVGRFRIPAVQSHNQILHRKGSGTNKNWSVYLGGSGGGAPGKLHYTASFGGVDTAAITSPATYVEDEWHVWVVGLLDKTTAYLMVDGDVIGTYTPLVSVDVQTAGVDLGVNLFNPIGTWCDARIYEYMSPDEARAKTATYAAGSEPETIASWRADDGLGSVITDYSPNANHATIYGSFPTDFVWEPTDLGMPEQAGQPMPAVHGVVFNAPAQLIDDARERYRWHDGQIDDPFQSGLDVRSRGVSLAQTADWDYSPAPASGVLEMVAEQDEPITYSMVVDTPFNAPWAYLSKVLRRFWEQRGGFEAPDIDTTWLTALEYAQKETAGIFVNQDTTVAQVSAEYVNGSGGFVFITPEGKLSAYFLFPALCFGPYGEPCVEFTGRGTPGLNFGNVGGVSGDHTICLWIFRHSLGYSVLGEDLITKSNLSTRGYDVSLSGGNAGRLTYTEHGVVPISEMDTVQRDSAVKLGVWTFVAATRNETTKATKIYAAEIGNPLVEIASLTGHGTTLTGADDLILGGEAVLGMQHAQVWDELLDLADLQALMNVHPVGAVPGLAFYAPLNEGKDIPYDLVSGTPASVFNGRWAPREAFHLNSLPYSELSLNRAVPAKRVTVGYRKNHRVMTPSDVSASVSQADLLSLTSQHLSVSVENGNVRSDFLKPREISIVSPFKRREGAEALAMQLLSRLNEHRKIATLRNAGRRAILLDLTDEVMVSADYRLGMTNSMAFRVVGKTVRLSSLTADLHLWGGNIAPEVAPIEPPEGEGFVTQDGIGFITQDGETIVTQG